MKKNIYPLKEIIQRPVENEEIFDWLFEEDKKLKGIIKIK